MTHILIVDDNPDIRQPLARYLGDHGMRVTSVDGGKAMRETLKNSVIDLILLDIMMPGEDGLSLCRFVQSNLKIPVILLTALTEDTDRVVGLEMGADDYVAKPFNPRVLLAKIKAVLRRSQSFPVQVEQVKSDILIFDDWRLDINQRELINKSDVTIALSAAEYRLLKAFLLRPQAVLTRDQLLDLTHGREAKAFDRSIDNLISRLRRKVEVDPSSPKLIKTVWGGGYSLSVPVVHQ
ncbi:DNA-binding response regulator [Colwellia sp. 75C3]|uniref:DNA-binding response regulator n=1 Tax=Colwellia psychrerythraea (strain 34H / ATCC BAA-681) TaxID=167879 RepID=Q482B3_COLP3|nr:MULTISPECIES: response regulator [Colwellia]AAZ26999.1 DNA-binding response regulator [Colwellia psychrerythraea 34H]PKG81871.1 DNA-binding response regulator [Colwellia sp. 75C3]